MAYNNGFPISYPQYGYQPYQPYQVPQTPQIQPVQQNPQSMTPPTIHAEIVQVDDEQAAANYPVGAGASQMMIAKDDSAIFVKTANASGYDLAVFIKRPPAPPTPVFDPENYVRRDEIAALVAEAMASQPKTTRTKKEVAE